MPEGWSVFSSDISCSHKCYHFSPHPCCTWLFQFCLQINCKNPKPWKSRLMSTERNLVWGEITHLVQSDVNIFWFSFWLSRFLFSSAKWKPFVQSEIGHLTAIVVSNKKEIKKISFNCCSTHSALIDIVFSGYYPAYTAVVICAVQDISKLQHRLCFPR